MFEAPPSNNPTTGSGNQVWDDFTEWLGYGAGRKSRDFNSAEANIQRQWQEGQNKLDRQFNSAEAQKARDFQREMRDSTYQATVADLEKAGLNPVLAYMNGGSATPTTATASHSASGGSSASWSGMSSASGLGSFLSGISSFFNTISKHEYRDFKLNKETEAYQAKTEKNLLRALEKAWGMTKGMLSDYKGTFKK